MTNYQIIPAQQDWKLFIEIYNRATTYAPYTIPLTQEVVDLRLEPFCQKNEFTLAIGLGQNEEGIIHASRFDGEADVNGDKPSFGMIHLLFASSTRLACHLLEQAEGWFREQGLTKIQACGWQQNPWQFVLHGAESYVWGGAYPTINAFRRMDYDIELDVVVMSLEMTEEPTVVYPNLPGFLMVDVPGVDDIFARTGEFRAYIHDKPVGVCGYQYLKAISNHYQKGLGQIYISADSKLHGQGVGPALLNHAHRALFQLGARRVILTTNQALFRAIKFYEKHGYRAEVIRGYWYTKLINGEINGKTTTGD